MVTYIIRHTSYVIRHTSYIIRLLLIIPKVLIISWLFLSGWRLESVVERLMTYMELRWNVDFLFLLSRCRASYFSSLLFEVRSDSFSFFFIAFYPSALFFFAFYLLALVFSPFFLHLSFYHFFSCD